MRKILDEYDVITLLLGSFVQIPFAFCHYHRILGYNVAVYTIIVDGKLANIMDG
jgi:hypothetical protein